MANTIKMKQSAVASKVPTTGQLQLGELAVNTYDGKLYLKKNVSSVETVVEVGGDKLPLSGGTLSGQMVIDHAGATGDALRITLSNASATGNAIVVEDSTNPDSTPWAVDNNGNTIHGHTASLAASSAQTASQIANGGKSQIHGTTTQLGTQLMAVWNATAGAAPALVFAKSDGATPGTYTATASGDTLGFLSWQGADGTQFNRAADIRAVVNGTVSAGVVPGSLSFRVANSAGTLTERLLIINDGTTTVTGSLNATGGLQENGVALSAKYAAIGSGGTSSFVSMAKWGTD